MHDLLLDQADQLHERLLALRAAWRGWPVMERRLEQLSQQALQRYLRRIARD